MGSVRVQKSQYRDELAVMNGTTVINATTTNGGANILLPEFHFDKQVEIDWLSFLCTAVSSADETLRVAYKEAGQSMADAVTANDQWVTPARNARVAPTGFLTANTAVEMVDSSAGSTTVPAGSTLFVVASGTATALAGGHFVGLRYRERIVN